MQLRLGVEKQKKLRIPQILMNLMIEMSMKEFVKLHTD